MKCTDIIKQQLKEANAEFLIKDLNELLQETNLTNESLLIRLVLASIDFSSSAAILLIIKDRRIIVTKSYPYSKVKSSLSLKYEGNLIK